MAPAGPVGRGSRADWHFPLESDLSKPMAWEGQRPSGQAQDSTLFPSFLGAQAAEGSEDPENPWEGISLKELMLWGRHAL